MRPSALLFDLDGTLVDTARGIAAALTVQSQARGGDAVRDSDVRPLISQGVGTLVREALGSRFRDPNEDVAEFRAMLASSSADPASIFPGVINALACFDDLGHRMAVVTNKPERIARSLLAQLNLDRFFRAVVGGDTLTVCKPDPAPLHHAQGLLADTGRAVMIGDSAVDAAAAAAAQMPFMLFEGGYGFEECQFVMREQRFDHFDRLPHLLTRRGGRGRLLRRCHNP
jgi:phosphoglycolate phosphatase